MTNILQQLREGAFINSKTPLGALFYGLLVTFLAWLVGRALRLAIQRVLAYDKGALVDRTTVKFLGQFAQIGVYLFAFISYAHLVPALSGLGHAWLASVGVISVVAGLAAQSTLSNLIAGFSLLLYRPFKVGDRLQIAAPSGLEIGEVESVNLGYTALKTDDNRLVVVPNSVMASQTTVNLNAGSKGVYCSVPFPISCDSDPEQARRIILELAGGHPKAKSVGSCPVTQVGANGLVLTLGAWCAGPDEAYDFKCQMLEQASRRFAAEGIRIPFPHTMVTLVESKAGNGAPAGGARAAIN